MTIKPFENYVATANPDSLAERLVNLDPVAAADLAGAIEAHLQDKFMNESTWGEFAEEGLTNVA